MSKSCCAVLCILMLLACDFRCVHGRCLKCKRCRHLVKVERMKRSGKTLYAVVRATKVVAVEAFRPTSPGPSPGAGHAVRN